MSSAYGFAGFRLFKASGLALLGIAVVPSAAAGQEFLAKEIDGAFEWTPAEYQNAVPLELPRTSLPLQEFLDQEPGYMPPAADSQVWANGQDVPEADEIPPDLEARLFPEVADDGEVGDPDSFEFLREDGETLEPQDVGQDGALFSSSRLIPFDARTFYPYRAVGKLFLVEPGVGGVHCSGAVIRRRLVLTAGHCVHSGSGGDAGFNEDFVFVPAYHEGNAPYRRWKWTAVWTTTSWATSLGQLPNRADFGLIEVADQRFRKSGRLVRKRIGDVTGFLGYRTGALLPNHTKQLGYPSNHDRGEIMHQVDSQHFMPEEEETVLYGDDMGTGSSGGPWVENFGRRAQGQTGGLAFFLNRVVGVTSYGPAEPNPRKVLGSSTLNDEFLAMLDAACSRRARNC